MFAKKMLSLLLALVLCTTWLPGFALAAEAAPAQISVTFRLIGDSLHPGTGAEGHSKYVTWIPITRYTVEEGTTALDLFEKALAANGMGYDMTTTEYGSYLSAVQAPSVLGGFVLSEMTNASTGYDGWMYMVNETSASVSMGDYVLSNNDKIIVHYVDDMDKEMGGWDGTPAVYPNRWKEAADVKPQAPASSDDEDDNSTSGGGGGSSTPDFPQTKKAEPKGILLVSDNVISLTDAAFQKALAGADGIIPLQNADKLTTAMLHAAGKTPVRSDVTNGKKVLARLTFNPAEYKGTGTVELGITGRNEAAETLFAKHFGNTVRAFGFRQSGSFGMNVRACIKMDLTGLDLNNLLFYSYDADSNSYALIKEPNYKIDANGFLHFTTARGGIILVTDRVLKRLAA